MCAEELDILFVFVREAGSLALVYRGGGYLVSRIKNAPNHCGNKSSLMPMLAW